MNYITLNGNGTNTKTSNIITLTAKQYSDIKKLLLKVKKEKVTELSVISNTITYYHSVSSQSYMRVKRYLKKYKLIKRISWKQQGGI